MIRILIAATALACSLVSALAQTSPMLKANATVAGDIVRIGDLVDNAGAAADIAVFRAPDAGDAGVVSAEAVLAALRAKNVIGVDTRGLREITVTREARSVSQHEFETRIIGALANQYGLGDTTMLRLSLDTDLPAGTLDAQGTRLRIGRTRFDARSGRFDMSLESDANGGRAPLRIAGTITEMADFVVLTRPLDRGVVIREGDVAVERRAKAELAGGEAIVLTSEVIGTAPRRALRPGQPLKRGDVTRPEVIQKNDLVTIVYDAPGLTLTLRGKAMESAAVGDVLPVTNIQSKRVLQATAVAPGEVRVSAGGARLADIPSNSSGSVR